MITGKKSLTKLTVLMLLIAAIMGPYAALAGDEQPVVILLSDQEEAYSSPIEGFSFEIDMPVETFNLQGDIEKAPSVMARILAKKPRLIFALGAKAAMVSKVWTVNRPEIPVIFAMVLNWERYNLIAPHGNVAGIAYDIEPGTFLANLSMVSPASDTIGVIYNDEQSGRIVELARKAAAILNLKLIEKTVDRSQDFQRAFKSIADDIDSYWILTDPVVYTLENISWLEKRCLKNRLICIGPSENVAKLGVVLSVEPDVKNIGIQAASMARSILEHKQSPGKIGIMPPIGTRLFINNKTARKIGLQVNQNVLDNAAEVIN